MFQFNQKRIAPLIIILSVIGILVVGGGVAYYFLVFKKGSAANTSMNQVISNLNNSETVGNRSNVVIDPESGQPVLNDSLVILTSGQGIEPLIREFKGIITVSVPETGTYEVQFPVSSLDDLNVIAQGLRAKGVQVMHVLATNPANSTNNNSNLVNQNSNISDETASWETYENTKYNYQIKYPADWPTEVDGIQVWENSVSNPELGNTIAFYNTSTEPDGQVGMVVITISAVENPKKLSPRDFFMEILKNPIDTLGTDLDPLLRYNLDDMTFKGMPALKITDTLRGESRWSMVARETSIYDISLSVDNFSKREFHIPPEQIFQEMFDSLTFTAPISPNSPSYIELSSCPEMSQYVINANGFPKEFIHLCSDIKYGNILGGPYYIVEIKYGQAQDCPAGCFYESFIGAVKESDRTIIRIPANHKSNLLTAVKLPDYDFQKRDFSCDSDIDDVTTMKFAQRNNALGWDINFTKALICSWQEVKSTKVTYDNDFIHTGDEVARMWDGNIFVSLKDNEHQWNFDGLITGEISRKEITFNE